jgi:hypothetical protein
MKKYIVSFLYSLILVSCSHKQESVQFKLPEVMPSTSGEAVVKKKEFVFPTVPYAR